MSVSPDNYVYIELTGAANTTPLGTEVTFTQAVDYVTDITLVWFAIEGLAPGTQVAMLDLQAGGETFMKPTILNTTGRNPRLVPLPVGLAFQTYLPMKISSCSTGQRMVRSTHIRLMDPQGAPLAFTNAYLMIQIRYSHYAPPAVHVQL
jgi:hypothetical protein